MFFFAGLLETSVFKYDSSRAPGDFAQGGILGFPNGATMKEGESKQRKLNVELANGRLAMMAIIGMFFQDGLTGSAWGDWELYTASPLRDGLTPSSFAAPKQSMTTSAPPKQSKSIEVHSDKEVGVTAPLGYWDPAGLAKNKTDEEFRNLRTAELKHGRVCMLAIVGLLGQASGWRFAGFEDVPSGIQAAVSDPGAGGLGALVLFVGFFELNFLSDEGREPGNFGDPFQFNSAGNGEYDLTWRNFEISNGRLAMIGFIGSVCAEYISGYDVLQQWQYARPVAIETIKKTLWFAP